MASILSDSKWGHMCPLFTAVSPFKGASFEREALLVQWIAVCGTGTGCVQSQVSSAIYIFMRTTQSIKHRLNLWVGMATGYGLEGWVFRVWIPRAVRIFSSQRRPNRFWGQPNPLPNGYKGLFPRGVKRPGHEFERSYPTSAKVKNT
jgi:hypothetical protein